MRNSDWLKFTACKQLELTLAAPNLRKIQNISAQLYPYRLQYIPRYRIHSFDDTSD
jgi:hypothetical protein